MNGGNGEWEMGNGFRTHAVVSRTYFPFPISHFPSLDPA